MASKLIHFSFNPRLSPLHRRSIKHSSSSYRPINISMFDGKAYWASINEEIEAHLEQALPIRDPLTMHEPLHNLVMSAPRTMAPALLVAACDLAGGQRTHSIAAASALHLMHAASFTHEHMPNVLGKPGEAQKPGPAAYPANIELLSGDAILPLGYELMVQSVNDVSDRALGVIVEMSRAMGAQGMVEGQYMHVTWYKDPMDEGPVDGWVRKVSEKKEGGLYACGAACGAILGGASEDEVERLRRYGFYIGMVYGMLYGVGRDEKRGGFSKLEAAKRFRSLALLELDGVKVGKVGPISSLLDVCCSFEEKEEENTCFVMS
ncbi:heterodimeric geranylgeranyl pyrophosphate synthase small subunit 2, chloroplastic-like [Tasmannia lanceolata]|uniref:heterodimeric geranylgeranyl pyrophosphate synthase small subunit 2, chloroplastic-like n=1 Tax=Tasmannia lanceolata TaxID=3420 RepID=UPI00406498DA